MPRTTSNALPELLAPAGNRECLHAAVAAGADAVYLGLGEFNARRNAGNFTLEQLREACAYAHLRAVRVYVAMNVEILPGELERAVRCIAEAYQAGADAFIIQDIGLAFEVHRAYPCIPLHASTQMNIHNAAGIEMAAALGFSRVTLARELAMQEIAELAALAAKFDMKVECFAHGALCICYSGQCLMSSMIGGRSANRGLCAQACRLPYELRHPDEDRALPSDGEHLLSPKDLCAIDMLDQMAEAGVGSLKIEGRMKSADYVYNVVSVYREVLDSLDAGETQAAPLHAAVANGHLASEEQHARLSEAFSRGFTTAYLESQRGNEIMSYGRPNNRGVFAGRVISSEPGQARVRAEIDLHAGDLVEFWTGRGHFTASIPEDAAAKTELLIDVDERTGKGDRVFRVRNSAAAFEDDEFAPRIPLTGRIALHHGQPLHLSFCAADGTQVEVRGPIVEAARTKELTAQEVLEHIDRMGQTPFELAHGEGAFSVELDSGVGMGFSQLHNLRREALEALEAEMLAPYAREALGPYGEEPHGGRPDCGPRKSRHGCKVAAWVTNPGCARAAKRAGGELLYVPLVNFRRGQACLEGIRQEGAEQAGYPKQCIPALPTIEHDPLPGTREYGLSFDIWDYIREGKPVLADNMADAWRALQLGALVEIGPHVPITNAASLRVLASMGIERVWLSPELTLGQIADLAEASPIDLGLTVAGRQELMVTEHCLLMSQGPCNQDCENCPRRSRPHHLLDRKGFEFPIITDALGRSHLYNGIELDAVPTIPDLIDIGISAVMVDTTFMGKETAGQAVRRAVRARDLAVGERRTLDKRPGTTTGHLFRGVM